MRAPGMTLILLLSLFFAGCAPSQSTPVDTPALTPTLTNPALTATVATTGEPTTAATTAATEGWATYHNQDVGYQVDYPVSWSVTESTDVNSGYVTTFTVPGGGEGIVVSVQTSPTTGEDIPDLPNTHCQEVTVSGLSGRRCLDTLSLSTSTTLFGDGRQYILTSFGKHLDQAVYQRFLESFAVTP